MVPKDNGQCALFNILEIAVDFWLKDLFAEAQPDPEVEDFVQTIYL
jgi:hypothetical protein